MVFFRFVFEFRNANLHVRRFLLTSINLQDNQFGSLGKTSGLVLRTWQCFSCCHDICFDSLLLPSSLIPSKSLSKSQMKS
ncbi:hypothetical protein QVD17_35962 [Tagetes erecta]|uniref:Uncharacterized protein n=1 Tax=Tagetes erecta TaxID=13708 RepID=A0AAD8JVE3_TARER|nr:hypothetical protein QVD17_35962 [Tagetes erecta]